MEVHSRKPAGPAPDRTLAVSCRHTCRTSSKRRCLHCDDAWQLENELQTSWASGNKTQFEAVLQYGKDFLRDFQPVRKASKNGAFITSCICHGCPWRVAASNATGTLAVNGISPWKAYANWYNGVDRGEAQSTSTPACRMEVGHRERVV